MFSYWGKAATQDGASSHHLLVHHSLDAGAVVECLLQRMPWVIDTMTRLLGLPGSESARVAKLIVFLAALHDLGKFANGFQMMQRDLWERGATAPETGVEWKYGGLLRHDALGAALLLDKGVVRAWYQEQGERPSAAVALRTWVCATCGHHGAPPDLTQAGPSFRSCFSERNVADARRFAAWARAALAPERLPVLDEARARRVSMLLAGLVSVADWIASNREWFPYEAAPLAEDEAGALEAYWRVARARADVAVDAARVVPRRPLAEASFAALHPEITRPSPLQSVIDGMRFDGQCLVFIEEMTGGGKTEAANLVAAKLMASGAAHGMYVALPTTATADAMAAREVAMYRRFFQEDGQKDGPSFAVVHGKGARPQAELSDAFGSTCADWMRDDRRRKLLAEIGVGTFDQAVLASVPSKFAAVRYFGLAGKAFVADEVHSYDGYEQEMLVGTVRLLAAAGASVVLVSATLSAAAKRLLATAFCEGSGFPLGDDARLADPRYPLVTVLDRDGLRNPIAPDPSPRAPRPKVVRAVRSVVEAEDVALRAARAGKCVLWARNTVDDANETARRLRDVHGHADVIVYHARFPDAVRARIQAGLLERFGKSSRGTQRAGAIAVTTQIIGASFDVDFDLVISDLKPVDEQMQTGGRGGRHPRDADGDPLPQGGAALDARGPHELVVVSPDPERVEGADWHRGMFPRAAYVYPNAGELWRSAHALEQRGEIAYPHGIRPLIEAVFGQDGAPDPLVAASRRADSKEAEERSLARPNLLDPAKGYDRAIAWGDDQAVLTRLGVSWEIVLVKDDAAGGVQPFEGDDWASGSMRLSSRRVRGIVPHGLPADVAVRIEAAVGRADIVRLVFDPAVARWRGALQGAGKLLPFTINQIYGLEWD